ncbi:type II toxin-antitoxin system RelE/ParE family toxin [Flavobacteriaceae bacterium F89]|uniref:Toxin n=1 Tax=Cerina litoralis TaxID=2874477 RepID=A0AAE3EWX7_9FLAO|nr:type II toxin-antitoxin system RelE/ParE family toxin [Cerina litoralis]MCG2461231.1 type II toxin-antitoxin system RelE/ParE family toxin [Cerina litoralis]
MGVYKLSRRAEFDLAGMYGEGIFKFGLLQARKYFLEMHDAFGVLAENTDLGRDASDFIPDLKRFALKAHTIFYLTTTDEIFIIRVLSQRMDYERYLF